MDIIPVALGLVIALSFGTSDYLSKSMIAQIGTYRTTIYVLALTGLGSLIPGFFLRSVFTVSPLLAIILLMVSSSAFLSFVFMYRAYSKGILSLTAPIVNVYPAFTVIISLLFLGTTLSVEALLALVAIIAGILVVSTSLSDLRKRLFGGRRSLAPGIGSALLAALFFGVSWTGFGFATQRLGYLLPALSMRGSAAVIGMLVAPALRRDIRPTSGRWIWTLLAMGLLETGALVTFSLGLYISPSPTTLPILTTFNGVAAAVTAAYAIVLLKERLEFNHVVGVILLISGVVALSYLTA